MNMIIIIPAWILFTFILYTSIDINTICVFYGGGSMIANVPIIHKLITWPWPQCLKQHTSWYSINCQMNEWTVSGPVWPECVSSVGWTWAQTVDNLDCWLKSLNIILKEIGSHETWMTCKLESFFWLFWWKIKAGGRVITEVEARKAQ